MDLSLPPLATQPQIRPDMMAWPDYGNYGFPPVFNNMGNQIIEQLRNMLVGCYSSTPLDMLANNIITMNGGNNNDLKAFLGVCTVFCAQAKLKGQDPDYLTVVKQIWTPFKHALAGRFQEMHTWIQNNNLGSQVNEHSNRWNSATNQAQQNMGSLAQNAEAMIRNGGQLQQQANAWNAQQNPWSNQQNVWANTQQANAWNTQPQQTTNNNWGNNNMNGSSMNGLMAQTPFQTQQVGGGFSDGGDVPQKTVEQQPTQQTVAQPQAQPAQVEATPMEDTTVPTVIQTPKEKFRQGYRIVYDPKAPYPTTYNPFRSRVEWFDNGEGYRERVIEGETALEYKEHRTFPVMAEGADREVQPKEVAETIEIEPCYDDLQFHVDQFDKLEVNEDSVDRILSDIFIAGNVDSPTLVTASRPATYWDPDEVMKTIAEQALEKDLDILDFAELISRMGAKLNGPLLRCIDDFVTFTVEQRLVLGLGMPSPNASNILLDGDIKPMVQYYLDEAGLHQSDIYLDESRKDVAGFLRSWTFKDALATLDRKETYYYIPKVACNFNLDYIGSSGAVSRADYPGFHALLTQALNASKRAEPVNLLFQDGVTIQTAFGLIGKSRVQIRRIN